jgi:hypothetical protein
MAILTFDMEEGQLEDFSPDGQKLSYRLLFGRGRGWLHRDQALTHLARVRGMEPGEAGRIAAFLASAGILSHFKRRMAPEDWGQILQELPDPAGVAA